MTRYKTFRVSLGLVLGATMGGVLGGLWTILVASCAVSDRESSAEWAIVGAAAGALLGAAAGWKYEKRQLYSANWITPIACGVVLFLIPALVLLPVVQLVKGSQVRYSAMQKLKKSGAANQEFYEEHGRFPPGAINSDGVPIDQRLGWMVPLLPFVGEDALYSSIDQTKGWGSVENMAAGKTVVGSYIAEGTRVRRSAAGLATSHFVGIAGVGADAAELPVSDPRAGYFGYDRTVRRSDIKDGVSQTMIIAAATNVSAPWTAAHATIRALDRAQVPYIGEGRMFTGFGGQGDGTFFLFADGSVRFFHWGVKPEVLEAAATIAGGEKIDVNDY